MWRVGVDTLGLGGRRHWVKRKKERKIRTYLLVRAYRYQYGMAGCCGRQDQLELGWTSSLSSLGQGWLELSTVGCGRRRECLPLPSSSSSTLRVVVLAAAVVDAEVVVGIGAMPTAAAIAVVSAGVAVVVVFIFAAEGGGEW